MKDNNDVEGRTNKAQAEAIEKMKKTSDKILKSLLSKSIDNLKNKKK